MKRAIIFCVISLVALLTIRHTFAKHCGLSEKPVDVVNALYRNHAWELQDELPKNMILLIDQPILILNTYFTPDLSALIIKNRSYENNTGNICRADFGYLSGSQDPGGISNIRINAACNNKDVIVLYDQNGQENVMTITFIMVKIKGCYRISDVKYNTRVCSSFPVAPKAFSPKEELSHECKR